jgi:hypothetical protein
VVSASEYLSGVDGCSGHSDGGRRKGSKGWEYGSGLRPGAEKNGGPTSVLLCAHERSVTSTVANAREKSKVTIWTKGPVVILCPVRS